MIGGIVTEDGVPIIGLEIAGRVWQTTVDTGFNSDFELPKLLKPYVSARAKAMSSFLLAGGVRIDAMVYTVKIPFDGKMVRADATFVDGDEILVGTGMLKKYRLEIDFPAATVLLERGA
jgi:predicted aspartyl protease